MGEIILGEVSVKAGLELAMPSRSADVVFIARVTVDGDNDGVVVVTIGEIIGSFNVVVADVTATSAAVAFAAAVAVAVAVAIAIAFVVVVAAGRGDEEGAVDTDDKCEATFFVYGGVTFALAIGLDAVVAEEVITETFFPPPLGVIGVVFFPLAESSGRTFDDAGTADTVISSSASQT